ncbi:MAG: hypothetical protein QXL86_02875 [Candidatus Aenigmatarchaeota archaeon]
MAVENSKRKNILRILLIILTIIILSQIGMIIELARTGRLAEVTTSSTVRVSGPLNIFNISVRCLQETVNPGQVVYSEISLKNIGTYEGIVKIEWSIEDAHGNILDSNFTFVYISYGYTWNSVKELRVPANTASGTYWFKVLATAPGYYGMGNDSFKVVSIAVGGAAIPSPPYRELKKNVEISYPTKFIIAENSSGEFDVIVKNTGEAEIANVLFTLEGLELSWFSIFPKNVTLRANETQRFKVKLNIPPDVLREGVIRKDYPIIITLVSKELVIPFSMNISVVRAFDYSQLIEKIRTLKKEVEILENESKILEEKGIDISEIKKLLLMIKSKFNEIEGEILRENPERATELIYETEELIDILKTVIKNKKAVEIARAFYPIQILIFSSLATVLIASLLFFLYFKKFFKSYKISEIVKKVKPDSEVSLKARLHFYIHGSRDVPNIYVLKDDTGMIYGISQNFFENGTYKIDGIVKKRGKKKYIEITKLKRIS